ncbi:MAG: glycosyltransferase family 2 protein [Bacteroidales bacterium]|jgi:glycosyltransferase involved in cell wall biosynthesis|nr:glycosyltransferase family 2 protein [Bacteroidales bacterium]
MPHISAVIISFNEEKYIGRCLASLEGIADEIVVVDSYSTDRTGEICRNFNVKFVTHEFEGYVEQKNYALSLASNRWVLSLDADESLSGELRESILREKESPGFDGYMFNRLNNYCGRWIRHSRWYPDRHLRLFDALKGRWIGPNPHDTFRLEPGCKSKRLKGDILHIIHDSVEEHVDKVNRFSTISAEEYFRNGKKAGPFTAHLHMAWSFFRSYILYAGFLDGHYGYTACIISAMGSFLKYSKLRKLCLETGRK